MKFIDPTRAGLNEVHCPRDMFEIRLAEVYLFTADFVKVLRTWAAKAGKAAAMQVTSAQLTLNFMLDERPREFTGKQLRWFDLKRTGKLLEGIRTFNPDNTVNLQDYHILRPILQTQLDAITSKAELPKTRVTNQHAI